MCKYCECGERLISQGEAGVGLEAWIEDGRLVVYGECECGSILDAVSCEIDVCPVCRRDLVEDRRLMDIGRYIPPGADIEAFIEPRYVNEG